MAWHSFLSIAIGDILGFESGILFRQPATAGGGNQAAAKVLNLRKDANFLLCTILWGNVSVNFLLALLSKSVLAGVGAFIFSTVGITFFGEIIPQAYFSRHALRVVERLINKVCVDTCNEHGWVIPFTQITVHQALMDHEP